MIRAARFKTGNTPLITDGWKLAQKKLVTELDKSEFSPEKRWIAFVNHCTFLQVALIPGIHPVFMHTDQHQVAFEFGIGVSSMDYVGIDVGLKPNP